MISRVYPCIESLEPRIAPATFVWDGSVSSDWFNPANWTPDGVPGALDTATLNINSTIDLPSSTSVAVFRQGAGTLNSAVNATFTVVQSLDWSGGTIEGGMLDGAGGAILALTAFSSGILDAVNLGADLVISNGATLTVRNGLMLNNAQLRLENSGNFTRINFSGTQSLSGTGEVIFAGSSSANALFAEGGGTQASAATLTLGSGVTVHGPQSGSIQGSSIFDRIINQGTVSADTGDKTITINEVSNQGTLSAPAGTLSLGGNWSNASGTLALSGIGVLNLGGTFTTAGIGMLNRTGGVVNITGVLDNTAATLALNSASGSWQLSGGTIRGGTVSGTGGAGLAMSSFSSGILDAVNLGADLVISNGATLTVRNGLMLNNAQLRLENSGNFTRINFSGTQSLSGTGEVIFAGSSSANALFAEGGGTVASAATLTLGSGVTVHGPQSGSIQGSSIFDRIINQGTVSADTGDKTITINEVSNQGTLSAPAGTLSLGGNWSNASGTLALSGIGVLNLGGTFTTAGIGMLNRTGGVVNITGVLDNTAATLALNSASGSWQLSGGTIRGGTVSGTGGAGLAMSSFSSGILDAVNLGADLVISNGATLTVRNGLMLNNAQLRLENSGNFTRINFSGTQSLSGTGEVIFAGSSSANALFAEGGGTVASAATLTLGSGVTVHGPQSGSIQGSSIFDRIINQGTVSADTGDKTITINEVSNQGTLSAPAGTLSLGGNWSNASGTLALSGIGVLNLGGTFTTAGIGMLNRTGGVVNITGVLDNTAATLALNSASGSWQLSGGTIRGGTVSGTGGAGLAMSSFSSGILDAVNLGADLVISNGATLTVRNGLMLNNAQLRLENSGNFTRINFSGTQSLSGTGEVIFAGSSSANALFAEGGGTVASAATLTLGSGVTVHGPQSGSIQGSSIFDRIINQGTVSADTGDKTITINEVSNQGTLSAPAGTLSLGGNWSNASGTLALSGIGVLNLGGTFTTAGIGMLNRTGGVVNITGVLDNTAATLALNSASGSWQLSGGTIRGGTVSGTGGAGLAMSSFSSGILDAVNLGADLVISNGATLTVRNGLMLNNAQLRLENSGNFTRINFSGTQSLSGTGEVIFAGSSSANALFAEGGGTVASAATLTLGSGVTVHGPQSGSIQGSSIFDRIINQGTVSADTGDKTITINEVSNQGTLSAPAGTLSLGGNWSNASGTLALSGIGVLNLGGTFTTAGIGMLNRTGGVVNITGVLDNTAATLALNSASGSWQLSGGTIQGGTVSGTGGAGLAVTAFSSGTLDAVNLGADLVISNGATLTVRNGLVLNNAKLTLESSGISTRVNFSGTQSLSGTGEVVFGGTASPNALFAEGGGTAASAATLTIGSGITVHGSQSGSVQTTHSFDRIINQGTISADTAGKTITLGGNFSQSAGAIRLLGGAIRATSTLNFTGGEIAGAGTITGSVNNTGATVRPGNALGVLTITGDYTQDSGGSLVVEIGGTNPGTQYDQLSIGGTAVLNGSLIVNLISGYAPGPGDVFNTLSAGSVSGTYSNVTSAGSLVATYTPTQVQLMRTATSTMFVWDGSTSSDWFTASNWTPDGVPAATDTAVLDINSTIILPSAAIVSSFIQSAGTLNGSGNLQMTSFIWSGGSQAGSGITSVSTGGSYRIEGANVKTVTGRKLDLAGRGIWLGPGSVQLGDGAIFENDGTFEIQNDATFEVVVGGIQPTFVNAGTVHKTSGSGITTFDGLLFDNSGILRVSSGTVAFMGALASFRQSDGDAATILSGGSLSASFPVRFDRGLLDGAGAIMGSVLNLGAIVQPGGDNTPGTLSISGDYVQGATATLSIDLGGTNAGAEHDQLVIGNEAILNGFLQVDSIRGFAISEGSSYNVLSSLAVTGAFSALFAPSGLTATGGGTGLTLTAQAPPTGPTSMTLTDPDGDTVTLSVNKGSIPLNAVTVGPNGEIQRIDLRSVGSKLNGATFIIDVQQSGGGDGVVNVGAIDASGMNLAKVSVAGDLGQIDIGSGDPRKPALKSLMVGSLGKMGVVTQLEGTPHPLLSEVTGSLKQLTVERDVQNAVVEVSGKLGKVLIGGSVIDNEPPSDTDALKLGSGSIGVFLNGGIPPPSAAAGTIFAPSIGSVTVNGDLDGGEISAETQIKSIKILGRLISDDPLDPAILRVGKNIAKVVINGNVENALILAGYNRKLEPINADASIGNVVVKGDWMAASVVAGVKDPEDNGFGIGDTLIAPDTTSKLLAKIGSVIIKGTASGSGMPTDHSAITAQKIGALRIDDEPVSLTKGSDNIELDKNFRAVEI